MNCFEWRNRASDYLDGTLIGAPKREADAHLDSCRACSERHKRYRLIVTSIASQPRSTLPIPIRKAPIASGLARLDVARLGRSGWAQLPWYLRTTLEGMSIVLLILLGISVGPKLRVLYERGVDRTLADFAESLGLDESGGDNVASGLPLNHGKHPIVAAGSPRPDTPVPSDGSPMEDEFASEEGDEEDIAADGAAGSGISSDDSDIHVGDSEIWRFNFKTDNSREFRDKIVRVLTELKLPPDTPGLGGIRVPGGIQFNLMVPQSLVNPLKKRLQQIAPPSPEAPPGTPATETFTWYKNRIKNYESSQNPIPRGQTHVVIWLSQM